MKKQIKDEYYCRRIDNKCKVLVDLHEILTDKQAEIELLNKKLKIAYRCVDELCELFKNLKGH